MEPQQNLIFFALNTILLISCAQSLFAYHVPPNSPLTGSSDVPSLDGSTLETRGIFDFNPFKKSSSSCTVYHDTETGLYHTTFYLHWKDYALGLCDEQWTERLGRKGQDRETRDNMGYAMRFRRPILLTEERICLVEASSLHPTFMWELVRAAEPSARLPKCVCFPVTSVAKSYHLNKELIYEHRRESITGLVTPMRRIPKNVRMKERIQSGPLSKPLRKKFLS